MTNEPTNPTGDPLAPIKNVTSVEAEFDTKVAGLRDSLRTQLESIQRETESLVLRARADAERERETVLTAARVAADREADAIVAEGAVRAQSIRGKTPSELARQKEPTLSAVLAEFRSPGKRPGA